MTYRMKALWFIYVTLASVRPCSAQTGLWFSDNGNGIYRNPVLSADYSDPDVIRVGEDFYLISSSFHEIPAIPILHSKDLVNWTIIGHAVEKLGPEFDTPQQGKGVWAPSIRRQKGEFFIYFGDPDAGIFLVKSKKINGPWQKPILVEKGKGMIDPCPLWDDDGNAYLVHAWAKSRAGFNSMLTVHRMNAEGTALLDTGAFVFDGHAAHPTIEGPKFYKRNGWYYIFAPAGGVKQGWQTVLRSRSPLGPYEDRIVMDQGGTAINGPHQGGWVETKEGESWFMHFQDRGAYGRVVHLQPVSWKNDWPVIGRDAYGTGTGNPVPEYGKPATTIRSAPVALQSCDEFSTKTLGAQWQWNANPKDAWYSLNTKKGELRIYAMPPPVTAANIWDLPSILVQKISSPASAATVKIHAKGLKDGERYGLMVLGLSYSSIAVVRNGDSLSVVKVVCNDARDGGQEQIEETLSGVPENLLFRIMWSGNLQCAFSVSTDGKTFRPLGTAFTAREGVWTGARLGMFCQRPVNAAKGGSVDVDWFHVE